MSDSGMKQSDSSERGNLNASSREPCRVDEPAGKAAGTESNRFDLERFSGLCDALKQCLADIDSEVNRSGKELDEIHKLLALKKSEIKELYDIEASAVALKNLLLELKVRREEFEKAMETERLLWEEEKLLREKEDAEYVESVRLRRIQEEEEYKRRWSEERLAIRKKLEEELRNMRRQNQENQVVLENDLIRREKQLEEKEQEWIRLTRELELFMTKLMDWTVASLTGRNVHPLRNPDTERENSAVPPGRSGQKSSGIEGRLSQEDSSAPVVSLRELLLSKSPAPENIRTDISGSGESAPARKSRPGNPGEK